MITSVSILIRISGSGDASHRVNFSIVKCRACARPQCAQREQPPPPWRDSPDACARRVLGGRRSCDWWSRRRACPAAPCRRWRPTHIEQPGSRHSKPASRKMKSRPSRFGLALDRTEPGHHPRMHPVATVRLAIPPPRADREAAVGARADENPIDRRALRSSRPARAPYIRAPRSSIRRRIRFVGAGSGIGLIDGDDVLGAGAPGDLRGDLGTSMLCLAIENCVVIARKLRQCATARSHNAPFGAKGAGRRDIRRSCHPAPSFRSSNPTRSTDCRSSCALRGQIAD